MIPKRPQTNRAEEQQPNRHLALVSASEERQRQDDPGPLIQPLINQLRTFEVFSQRSDRDPELKRAVAERFLHWYLADLIFESHLTRFFFESGTSIAYLSNAFIDKLGKPWAEEHVRALTIETNNIVSFLQFVLSLRIRISLYPYGKPEAKYAATFGPLDEVPQLAPPLERRKLGDTARVAMSEIIEHLRRQYSTDGLIFMAASGMELDMMHEFPGPHVGSYSNMLFKRAILESNCPAILFLDEGKVFRAFAPGTCYSVCDQDLTWEEVCKTKPLALAIAFQSEQRADQAAKALKDVGLDHQVRESRLEAPLVLVATNSVYQCRIRPK